THFGKHAGFGHGPYAKQAPPAVTAHAAAIGASGHLLDLNRAPESFRTQGDNGGTCRRIFRRRSKPVIDDQFVAIAIVLSGGFARLCAREHIPKHVAPEFIEALPPHPTRRP